MADVKSVWPMAKYRQLLRFITKYNLTKVKTYEDKIRFDVNVKQ